MPALTLSPAGVLESATGAAKSQRFRVRPKAKLAVLLFACGLLALMAWVIPVVRSPLTRPGTSNRETPNPDPAGRDRAGEPQEQSPPPTPNVTPATLGRPAQPPVALTVEVEQILSQLENPDKATRAAALEEAVQLDDRSIIPRLRELAARTEDPQERAELVAAIDYINLPSVEEIMAEQHARRAAAGLPDPPRALTNRWTGKPFLQNPRK
jgi:hypothetical protein